MTIYIYKAKFILILLFLVLNKYNVDEELYLITTH